MVKLTCSLKQFLLEKHRNLLPLLLFGHVEVLTDEITSEYYEWCGTEHGKEYLFGGVHYEPTK